MADQVNSFNTSNLHEIVFSDPHYINKLNGIKNLLLHIEHNLRKPWQNIFMLIRPRGFGLSLAGEAIESLYMRDEMLLKHMDSLQQEQDFSLDDLSENPVIRLSLHTMKISNSVELQTELIDVLQRQLWEHHIKIKASASSDPRTFFVHLIRELYKKHKLPIVIIIDNYDAPIYAASQLKSKEEQEKALALYFDLLNIIRQKGDTVKFCLLTGHCKFALCSDLSEGLPHIIDLSYMDETATLLGFTIDEIKTYYKEELERIAPQQGLTVSEYLDALNCCYGGYVFSDKQIQVLCPYSVTRALENNGELYAYACNYDYSFLKDAFEEEDPDLDWLLNKNGQDALFLEVVNFYPQGKDFGAMLLQLGFVAIHNVTFDEQEYSVSWRYRFDITNVEMRRALYIIMGKAKEELRELVINPRVFDAGESDYMIQEESSTTVS